MDFSDVRDYKFNSECITDDLINTAIIYGKNAVGKTNFGLALFDIVTHLTMNNVTPGLYDYYLNANKNHKFATFEYTFIFDANEIIYKYRKNTERTICDESLFINSKKIFIAEGMDYPNGFQKYYINVPASNDLFPDISLKQYRGESLLKYIFYNVAFLDINSPLLKLQRFINNMLWFRSLDENRYIGYREKSDDYYTFIFNKKEYITEFNQLINQIGISNEIVAKKDIDGETRLYFDSKKPMPFFKVASNGTKAVYTFFYWQKSAPDVSFMFIDEFDAYYHYELAETLISMLSKMKGYQKILTSHNTNLLTNRIMRPDCYFILTPDRLTSLANATERELREGHNLEKLYMSGEFDG